MYGCSEKEERCVSCNDGYVLDQVRLQCQPVEQVDNGLGVDGPKRMIQESKYIDARADSALRYPSAPTDTESDDPDVKRKECESTSKPSTQALKAEAAANEAWRIHARCMTKLGLTHKQLGEQVLAMGELIGTVQQDLSVENDAKLQDEAAMKDKIREQQNKVVVDTENITISFNEQKKFCMRYEILAKRTDLILKTAVREDTLYCKKQETKAKLCRADNAKSYANIKKRRAEARVRSKEILTASMKAAKFAMNDETDTLNPKMDVLVVARVRHAMRAHRAAIAALNYLEYSEKIFRKKLRNTLQATGPAPFSAHVLFFQK